MTGEHTQTQDVVLDFATSPNFAHDGICFAARTSGLDRAEDGGRNWYPAYHSLDLRASLATTTIAVSPGFEIDHSVFAGVHGGILRSVDAGRNWYIATLPSPPPIVSTLAVSPHFPHDGILFAGTLEDGMFRSADRGAFWAAWNFGLLDLNILSMAISPNFANDATLFVGTESGMFYSTNGGRAWREVDFPSELAPVISLGISPNYANDGLLLAGTESYGLFSSQDRGHTWVRLGENIVHGAVNTIIFSSQFPTKPDLLILLDEILLVSRDGGQSWAGWTASLPVTQGIVSVVAPYGIDPNAPLLVGLFDGSILQI